MCRIGFSALSYQVKMIVGTSVRPTGWSGQRRVGPTRLRLSFLPDSETRLLAVGNGRFNGEANRCVQLTLVLQWRMLSLQ